MLAKVVLDVLVWTKVQALSGVSVGRRTLGHSQGYRYQQRGGQLPEMHCSACWARCQHCA